VLLTWASTLGLALLVGSVLTTFQVGPNWPVAMRDRWYTAGALALALWIGLSVEPGLGVMCAWMAWRWRSPEEWPAVLAWFSIAGFYALVQSQAATFALAAPPLLIALCAAQLPLALWNLRATYRRLGPAVLRGGELREAARGTMGNRVLVGCLGALVMPLCPPELVAIPLATIVVSSTWTGAVAGAAGWLVAFPTVIPPGVLLAAVAALGVAVWSVRGMPRDSLGQRWAIWRVAAWWWWTRGWSARAFGLGYDSFSRASAWWHMQQVTPQIFKQAHNDWLQHVFEYGALGALAVGLWLGRLGAGMAWGDPWSGVLVAGALCALVQFPCRVPAAGLTLLTAAAIVGAR